MNIQICFLEDAQQFLDSQNEKAREKILSDIRKTKAGLRGEWFRKMQGTSDLWEFRSFYNRTYYRLFAFWHTSDQKLIICTNGLVKKTEKTPKGEIERAERLKRAFIEKY